MNTGYKHTAITNNRHLCGRLWLFILLPFFCHAQQEAFVSMETPYGTIIVRLYNGTPVHRASFLKMVRAHYFDTTLFHRVVPDFVIQGGDPDSLFTTPADTNLLKQQRLMPEIRNEYFHKRGALGAGRDANVLEASFYSQFYIVQGRRWTDAGLDSLEKRTGAGFSVPETKRAIYRTLGGQPRLDGHYTIFGEVVQGMDVVDVIAGVKAVKALPVVPVRLKLRVLKQRKVKRLQRHL